MTIRVTRYFVFSLIVLLWLPTLSVLSGNRLQAKERNYRLIVSFYSICCGINGKAKEKLDEFVSNYERDKRTRLARETVNWGREGEIDYCFKLSGLRSREENRVVSEIKKLVKGFDLVHIQENAPCKNKRKK